MSLPRTRVSSERACEIARKWQIDARLADRLDNVFSDWYQETRIGISVISGFRTDAEQIALGRRGRPTAPVNLSTHTVCPATGADIQINGFVTTSMKAIFGRIAIMNGLRWGGGGPVDRETGIPTDWNHLDLGPRV